MSDEQQFPVVDAIAKAAWADNDKYLAMYQRSIDDPESFWAIEGKRIDWIKPYSKIKDVSYAPGDVHIKWFYDGTLNASANCLDRHLKERGDQTAILWEGDEPTDSKAITYRQLHEQVCRLANALKAQGIKKGDVVTIYMPMVPEAAVAMLACTRIGAIHSVVFGGFSPDSLAGRIQDCASNCVITADEGIRGGRPIPLKANTDAAIAASAASMGSGQSRPNRTVNNAISWPAMAIHRMRTSVRRRTCAADLLGLNLVNCSSSDGSP